MTVNYKVVAGRSRSSTTGQDLVIPIQLSCRRLTAALTVCPSLVDLRGRYADSVELCGGEHDGRDSYPCTLAVSVGLKVFHALVSVVTVLVHTSKRRFGRVLAWTMNVLQFPLS